LPHSLHLSSAKTEKNTEDMSELTLGGR
jgi:hypothetical protein